MDPKKLDTTTDTVVDNTKTLTTVVDPIKIPEGIPPETIVFPETVLPPTTVLPGIDPRVLTPFMPQPTAAQKSFDPLTQRSIRIQAPQIQPAQIAPTDARKELDNQLARLLNDPQNQRRQSLFGGLV